MMYSIRHQHITQHKVTSQFSFTKPTSAHATYPAVCAIVGLVNKIQSRNQEIKYILS